MKLTALVATFILLLAIIGCNTTKPKTAKAELRNAQNEVVGSATFTEDSEGVMVHIEASKLPPGQHGIHIHSTGDCTPPDFKTAGGHFNPDNKKHGSKNPQGMHEGDLENITVAADGTVKADLHVHHGTLGDAATSLIRQGGTSIVIHAQPDDEMTDPSGNSGDRIVCGVIK